jgi:CDP-diacylglycerol--glycerol-3-phosphate 3-phosphatidyltransferase
MNLANRLTLFRIALVPVFMFLFYFLNPWAKLAAGLVFGVAAYTDILDGRIARSRNQVTNFGAIMDPLADKLLVAAPLILFVELGLVPGWMLVVILAREFAISGLRIIAAGKGLIISASRTGKHKTASQISAIVIIFTLVFLRALLAHCPGWEDSARDMVGMGPDVWQLLFHGNIIPVIVVAIAVFFSIFSGLDYLWRNRHIFQGEF